MKLLVDHREKLMFESLKGICESMSYGQLSIGDYWVITDSSEVIIVERKTVQDFLSSVRSNRLWDQLLRLMKAREESGYKVKRRILLVHGNFNDYLESTDWDNLDDLRRHWSQLMGAFQEIVYVYNTPIIHAESDVAFRSFMRILIQREQKGKNDKLPEARWFRKPVKATLPVKDRRKYIIAAIPHIGNRLAENLLSHFGTILKIASASVEELQEVPKIGKKKAKLIHTMFH